MARNRSPVELQPHQPTLHTFAALLLQHLTADERLGHLQMHQPAQAHLKRGGGGVHVAAVEVHRRFESQGVAGSEAAGLHPPLQAAIPEGEARLRRQQQFKAVLTGVTGAGQEGLPEAGQQQRAMAEAG